MVGKAVAAIDPDDAGDGPDGDPDITLRDNLTYSLHGTDAASFNIDDGSGQITVKGDLDYETKQTHRVVVRATDGSRATANISVTITVTDVNEEPEHQRAGRGHIHGERHRLRGHVHGGRPRERRGCLELEGPDAEKFSISSGGVLSFKSPPNFDTAGDDDRNNMYEVTVVATDTVDNEGTKNVEVTVTNEDDPGSISFNVVQPGVGVTITATLNDQDDADEPNGATFQWARGNSANGSFTAIENATEETYTPGSADAEKFLQVTATYGADDNPKSVSGGFDHATAAVDVANPVPVFPDQNLVTPAKETARRGKWRRTLPQGTAVGDPGYGH